MYKMCWGERADIAPFSRFWTDGIWRVLIMGPCRLHGSTFIIRFFEVSSATISSGGRVRVDYR
jgi:hypothetical protein